MKTKFTWLNIGVLFIGLIAFGTLTQCKMLQNEKETFDGYKITLQDIDLLWIGSINSCFAYKEFFNGMDTEWSSHIGQDYTIRKILKVEESISLKKRVSYAKEFALVGENFKLLTSDSLQPSRIFVNGQFYNYSPYFEDSGNVELKENQSYVERPTQIIFEVKINLKHFKSVEQANITPELGIVVEKYMQNELSKELNSPKLIGFIIWTS